MKRGKVNQSKRISLPGDNVIRSLDCEDIEGYRYLGFLEADVHGDMKDKIRKEYFRRLWMVLKSKLNRGNTIKAINSLNGIKKSHSQ